jgi:hypothetical protein
VATLYGTPSGKDRFRGTQVYGRLTGTRDDGTDFFHRAVRFDRLLAVSEGGSDVAEFYDSAYGHTFQGTPKESRHHNRKMDLTVQGFPVVRAHAAAGGVDTAYLSGYDSGQDSLRVGPDLSILAGQGYLIRLESYDNVLADPDGDFGGGSAPATSAVPLPGRLFARDYGDADLHAVAAAARPQTPRAIDEGGRENERDAFDFVLQAQLWRP